MNTFKRKCTHDPPALGVPANHAYWESTSSIGNSGATTSMGTGQGTRGSAAAA